MRLTLNARTRGLRTGVGGLVLIAALGLGALQLSGSGAALLGLQNNSAATQTIAQGQAIYAEHCASCHGANLEGQPDWQEPLATGRMPAPPHDETGHTWHHPDSVLFNIVKKGTAAVVGGGYESDMPPFEGILSDDDISAVLVFIKSRWPGRERAYQEGLSEREREITSKGS
jgi:mono/diheme cytochrome c family protein